MIQTANNPDSSTLLDAEETIEPSLDPSDYRALRIHPVADEYRAAEELYSHLDATSERNRLHTLHGCRLFAWFVRDSETGLVHVASSSCKLRWCPVCARARSWFIKSQVFDWAQKQPYLRFLTLTLKHTSSPLSNQICFLYNCFRTLRRNKQFKKMILGGVWFFQVTYDSNTGYWHPHIHCLITGYYVPKDWLIRAWTRITKGSFICDIKLVKNRKKVADYVARYCSRPIDLKDFPLEQRVVIFESFHGRRLNGTWGQAKGVSLSPSRTLEETRYKKIGSWSVVYNCRDSDPNALMIYRCWKEKTPLLESVSMMDTELWLSGQEVDYQLDQFRKRYVQSEFW